jgi:uncharacterized membrane protein SpoIIM required for sporulation
VVSIDPIALVVLILAVIFAVGAAVAFGLALCRGVLTERRRASGGD